MRLKGKRTLVEAGIMKIKLVRVGVLCLCLTVPAFAADMTGALPWPGLKAPGGDIVSVDRLLHPAPAAAERELTLARKALIRDDETRGLEHLDRALQIYPQYAEAYSELGAALLRKSDAARALEALEQAVACDPKSVETRLNLGIAQLQFLMVEQAENTVRQAIQLDAGSQRAHYLLAVILNQKGDRPAAAAELRTYLNLDGRTYRVAAEAWLARLEQ